MTRTHLCDTVGSITEAVQTLKAAPFLFVDCEGDGLGTTIGQLSVISIGTPNAEDIYLIDVLSLSQPDVRPLLDLLEDEQLTKYVWDGRADNRELLETFHVPLRGAIDMTLVDILSREKRGEGYTQRLERLATRMHPLSQLRFLQTDGVHKLNSLRSECVYEHKINLDLVTATRYGPSGSSLERALNQLSLGYSGYRLSIKPDYKEFMKRPLPREMQQYAASDVEIIARVFEKFREQGYLDNRQDLLAKTRRFFETNQGRVPLNDIYKGSNILPLEVLNAGGDPVDTCTHCNRQLGDESFVHKSMGRYRGRQRIDSCKVCNILEIRKKLADHRAWQRERDYEDSDDDDYGFGSYDDYHRGYSS